MRSLFCKIWVIAGLILSLLLTGIQVVYSQDTQTEKEITTAIDDALSGSYQQAIPVLKKYSDVSGFDDLITLQIIVYLNFSYLATENEALNVDQVNKQLDSYLEKHGISKRDSLKRANEMTLLYLTGLINSNVGNDEKNVFYLLFIKHYYEENHLEPDQLYSTTLNDLTQSYYDLSEYKSAIEIGKLAWNINIKLFEKNNKTSLIILDLMCLSYLQNIEPIKSIEYLQRWLEIGKTVLGEKNPEYLTSLNLLASIYLTHIAGSRRDFS